MADSCDLASKTGLHEQQFTEIQVSVNNRAVASINNPMEKQNDVEMVRDRETDAAEAIAEPQSLSFPEVFRMIQAGEEVPGLQKLEIKPCHDQPTISQIPRKLKPWEK